MGASLSVACSHFKRPHFWGDLKSIFGLKNYLNKCTLHRFFARQVAPLLYTVATATATTNISKNRVPL